MEHLLSNRLRGTITVGCCGAPMPIVIVDWANLKGEGRWYLLRASIPVGGRTITLLNQLYPLAEQSTPKAQQDFLL